MASRIVAVAAIAATAASVAQAAVCSNYDEASCASMNDGGCSCFWNVSTCAMNASECSGFGITSVGGNCTLSGGEIVQVGWQGRDTGSNWCNTCGCQEHDVASLSNSGMLVCTYIACVGTPDSCTLGDGETVVSHGWSGHDNGPNWCNQCSCENGMLTCTEMGCIGPEPNCTLMMGQQWFFMAGQALTWAATGATFALVATMAWTAPLEVVWDLHQIAHCRMEALLCNTGGQAWALELTIATHAAAKLANWHAPRGAALPTMALTSWTTSCRAFLTRPQRPFFLCWPLSGLLSELSPTTSTVGDSLKLACESGAHRSPPFWNSIENTPAAAPFLACTVGTSRMAAGSRLSLV
eukprot:CAMPEP_0178403148 /NCGR_PEP_ID=MMETSP0689_2-20121128/17218_1 /TAXON_ID=160604 /ORGANISM="Amphidinium massartii, Strain CS-259" /LENGTH=351 /DNA_ID=CAMNT_0020024091 /DNA_START=74 /DNA_END=1130 /DNA_ORIENTATION=-